VLVLKADRLFTDLLCTVVKAAMPQAVITTVHSVLEADRAISAAPIDLIVSGVVATDGDAVDAITDWSTEGRATGGVFVVTERKEPVVLNCLSATPIRGIFDQTNEGVDDLRRAFSQIAAHGSYWSSSVRDAIARTCRSQESVFRQLTFTEQLVLSVIGDGRDDASAAEQLGMSETTVMTMRRNVHRKLGIQHKGELVRFAAANGFVIITPFGVVRPGLRGMMAVRKNRFRKRHSAHPTCAVSTWTGPLGRVA
jgi:DNA-binding NarL/FixJ family response regulator